jgi:biopolymer transport protein TolQ
MGALNLIFQAGLVAKIVLLLLLIASIISWTIILSHRKWFRIADDQNRQFLEAFWTGRDIDSIYNKAKEFPQAPLAIVFQFTVKELRQLSSLQNTPLTLDKMGNIHRSLLRSSSQQVAAFEQNLGFLATLASTAPFLGLFGTVWGIMNSFQSIGNSGAAQLSVVAPGISEALITTATGIAVALPAAAAYNYFVGKVKKIAVELEIFSHDFSNIIERNVFQHAQKESS